MPDDPNTLPVVGVPQPGSKPVEVPTIPSEQAPAPEQGTIPAMHMLMAPTTLPPSSAPKAPQAPIATPTGTGVVSGIAAGIAAAPPVVAPTHDIAADYHQQAQKDASIQSAIWAPHAASIEDEQNLGAAQAFGFDSETAHKLDQLHQGALNIGTMMGQAVPQSIQEVKDHPFLSALKIMGMVMNPPGAIASAAIGSTVEETLHQKYPEYPWIGTTAGVVSSLLSGNISGIGGEATAATKASTILDEAGNPMVKAAETLSPEAIAEQTRGVQPQLESYAKGLKEHIANPSDEEFQNLAPGTILNAEQTANLNIKTNTRVDNLSKLARAYMTAEGPEQQKIAMDLIKQELVPTAKMIKTSAGVAAEHGRALAIHNTDWSAVSDMARILANKSDKDWDSFARALSTLETSGASRMTALEAGQRELALSGSLASGGRTDSALTEATALRRAARSKVIEEYMTAGPNNPIPLNNLEHNLTETGQMSLDLGDKIDSGQSLLNLTGQVHGKDPNFPNWAETPGAREAADRAYQNIQDSKISRIGTFIGQWLSGRPFYKALVNAQLMNPRIVASKIATDVVYQPYNITAQSLGTMVHFRNVSAGVKLFTGAMLASYNAIPDAWKFAKMSMRSGLPEFQKTIGEVNSPRIFGEDYGNTIPGKAANWMASAYGIGARAILGTDQFAKTVAYRAEMHTQAFYKGLQDAEELGLRGSSATRQAIVQAKAYMETLPKWLLDKAEENAARDTFTDEDKFTQAAKAISEAPVVGGAVRMAAPFTRTPINLLEQGMISSPMAGFTHKFWRDMGEGGLAADTDLAKMAMGTLFMGWVVHHAAQGNITGQAPIESKARDQFNTNFGQEESARIGDNMYSMKHIGVISTPFIMAANYAQYSAQMDPQDRQALAMATAHAFARVVSEAPLLEPTMHLMDAIGEGLNSWDASGQPSKGAQRAMGKFAGEEISSFIPAPLKIAADAYSGEHVELNGVWDASKARIPGFGLPSHKDQYGYTQYLPHGSGPSDVAPTWYSSVLNSISPITVDHARNPDAVDKEEMRVGFVPSRVPNTLYARDPKYPISLTPQERDRWSVLAGHELKKPDTIDGSETLDYHDAKVKLINSDYYKNLADPKAGGYSDPDIAKLKQAAEIRKLHDGYIEAARVQMTGYTSKGFSGHHGENAELENKAARRAKLEAPSTVVAN